MSSSKKILSVLFGIIYLSLVSLYVSGQAKAKKSNKKDKVMVGFQRGRELLFNSSPLMHSKQSKVHTAINNRIVLRKPLNTHFKVETGINYSVIQNQCCVGKISDYNPINFQKQYKLSLPITIQYNFLSEQCRVRPYIGAGLQYNFYNKNISFSPPTSDYHTDNNPLPETKYISIIFTQGVTFEVNTKIQICGSLHFIPDNNKTIGIDLGIGYHLP